MRGCTVVCRSTKLCCCGGAPTKSDLFMRGCTTKSCGGALNKIWICVGGCTFFELWGGYTCMVCGGAPKQFRVNLGMLG